MPIMTGFERGTVVLLPFPFSDQSSAKIRPAVIVSGPYPSDDVLVVALTSVAGTMRPGEFAIGSWREAGLLHPSFAKRAIASVSTDLIHKRIGWMSAKDLADLDSALRLWFGI
jgi:mRNA interferase MazF